jgi:response regulator NasT
MRVAVIKNGGNIDTKIDRILKSNKINGDFIDKFTRNSIKMYDTIIFTYKNNIPNLSKVIEQIVLEKKILVIFIDNKFSVGQFHNVLNNLFFSVINDQTLDVELPSILKNTEKYIKEIYFLNNEVNSLKERLDTINLVNKAKRILSIKGYSEDDSHQFIQKKSMDLRLSKKLTAELIIKNKIDF